MLTDSFVFSKINYEYHFGYSKKPFGSDVDGNMIVFKNDYCLLRYMFMVCKKIGDKDTSVFTCKEFFHAMLHGSSYNLDKCSSFVKGKLFVSDAYQFSVYRPLSLYKLFSCFFMFFGSHLSSEGFDEGYLYFNSIGSGLFDL